MLALAAALVPLLARPGTGDGRHDHPSGTFREHARHALDECSRSATSWRRPAARGIGHLRHQITATSARERVLNRARSRYDAHHSTDGGTTPSRAQTRTTGSDTGTWTYTLTVTDDDDHPDRGLVELGDVHPDSAAFTDQLEPTTGRYGTVTYTQIDASTDRTVSMAGVVSATRHGDLGRRDVHGLGHRRRRHR